MSANKKIKLVVVSSYGRPCGIAQYAEHIVPALQKNPELDISVISLPVDVFRSDHRLARRKSKELLKKICLQCSEADVVNIQFEHGLYGKSPFIIYARLKKIIRASKKVFITYHTGMSFKSQAKFNLGYVKAVLRDFKRNYVMLRLAAFSNKQKNNVYHIVHTEADKENMMLYAHVREEHVFSRPLSFLTAESKEYYRNTNKTELREQYFGNAMLTEKIVGIFGFLQEMKGIETAINALPNLPANYHLAIIGGLHPENIALYVLNQSYIKKITKLINKHGNIFNRIHFFGSVSNDDFTNLMAACDMVALPYAETMQSSSGPAGVALDLGMPLLCSNNRCFIELGKFAKNCITYCEISNDAELARKAKLMCEGMVNNFANNNEYSLKYNVEARAQLYRDICDYP